MLESLTELKGCLRGHDIHVIAAGPSAGHIDPSYFNNKWTIGVNEVWRRFKVDYLVYKEINRGFVPDSAPLIVSRHHCGVLDYEKNTKGHGYYFEHTDNLVASDPDLSVIGTDKMVVSYSTITSAINIAAYMGAENIILVGHDCGMLDGQENMPGYPSPIKSDPGFYRKFLGSIEKQTIMVRDRIQEVYGCKVYSLNPFLNFGLEGHKYEPA